MGESTGEKVRAGGSGDGSDGGSVRGRIGDWGRPSRRIIRGRFGWAVRGEIEHNNLGG